MFKLSNWTGPINLLNWPPSRYAFRPSKFLLKGVHAHSMSVQGLFPLTHWCSCALIGCSGGVQYSLIGIHVHSHAFRGCSIITQRHSCALTSVQDVFSSDTNAIFLMVTPWWVAFNNDSMAFMHTQWVLNTHQLAFMRIQWVFRGCSHSLIGIHVHSQAFRGCSIITQGIHMHSQVFRMCSVLTQMQSFSWAHHSEMHSIMTHLHSCAFNGCSILTNWHLCTLNWCSGGVKYSLIDVHVHSQVFRRCSIRVQPVHVPEGPMNMFYKFAKHVEALWTCSQFPLNTISLASPSTMTWHHIWMHYWEVVSVSANEIGNKK
jgi:hypothetical protein